MTRYQKVVWQHDLQDEPVALYSEVRDFGVESRKVEVYSDGRLDYADTERTSGSTFLSETPMPSIEEIEDQSEFTVTEISEEDFEAIWRQATLGTI